MNNNEELEIGIATSASQHETPTPADFDFIEHIQKTIALDKPEDALNSIYNRGFENAQTPLSEIGLNLQAIKNLIKGYIEREEYDEGMAIVKSIADILVFGIDNEDVFDKYINILKLFNLKLLRISLRWDKIVTETGHPNAGEINIYRRKCEKLIENGIEPIVTFSHFETRGMDLNSEDFKHTFKLVCSFILDRLVEIGVKYFIAFNEPAVHSGGIIFFWGKGEFSIKNLQNHFKTLGRFGELSKEFYKIAKKTSMRYAKEVKIIANFNVALFDPGISSTVIDRFLVWIADKVDKNAQINPFLFEDGTYAFDILALNPYQIYDFAWVNKIARAKIPVLIKKLFIGSFLYGESEYPDGEIDFEELIKNTSNPDFNNQEEVRYGSKGEILYPKAIGEVIRKIIKEFNIRKFVVTESGADINSKSENGIKDKLWYLKKVKAQINELRDEGISIPFALIWTLIRMWEIVGPLGGGIGNWDFGILGEPLHKTEISSMLIEHLQIGTLPANIIAERIVRKGNTPVRIYAGMIESLGEIFISGEITPQEVVNSFITKNKDYVVNILQIILLKQYYQKTGDKNSEDYLESVLTILMSEYAEEVTSEFPVAEQ